MLRTIATLACRRTLRSRSGLRYSRPIDATSSTRRISTICRSPGSGSLAEVMLGGWQIAGIVTSARVSRCALSVSTTTIAAAVCGPRGDIQQSSGVVNGVPYWFQSMRSRRRPRRFGNRPRESVSPGASQWTSRSRRASIRPTRCGSNQGDFSNLSISAVAAIRRDGLDNTFTFSTTACNVAG